MVFVITRHFYSKNINNVDKFGLAGWLVEPGAVKWQRWNSFACLYQLSRLLED